MLENNAKSLLINLSWVYVSGINLNLSKFIEQLVKLVTEK